MEETQSYLALQGWSDMDSAKDLNLKTVTEEGQNTRQAILLCLRLGMIEPFFHLVLKQVHYV
jgi:hypothetical protein